MTKRELIDLCLELPDVAEAYPFDLITAAPDSWAAIQHRGNKKTIAFVSVHKGRLIINLKCEPALAVFLREQYKDLTAGYHMNKEHWNTIYPDGDVPVEALCGMIKHSYELTKPKQKKK